RVLDGLAAAGRAGDPRARVAGVDEVGGDCRARQGEQGDRCSEPPVGHGAAYRTSGSSFDRNSSGVSAVIGSCWSVPPVVPAKNVGVARTCAFVACCSEAASAASTSAECRSAIIFAVSKRGIDAPIRRSSSSLIQPEFSAPWLL